MGIECVIKINIVLLIYSKEVMIREYGFSLDDLF